MNNRIQETIERLRSLALDGDSDENLSVICSALYQPDYGWTVSACSTLREILIGWLEQLDPAEWADEYLDEVGLVRLPKDADGEVIHVGDTVVYVNCDSERGDVTSIEYGSGCVTVVVDHGRAEMGYGPQELRHHHKPTVEDVLCEFINAWLNPMYEGNVVAAYAAKLREVMADE